MEKPKEQDTSDQQHPKLDVNVRNRKVRDQPLSHRSFPTTQGNGDSGVAKQQLSPGGCCALTSEEANTLISQPMMTVSAISPSVRRMDLPVLSQPALDVLGRLFLFLFLGCDPQHKPRRRWTIICFHQFDSCRAKQTRSHKVGT